MKLQFFWAIRPSVIYISVASLDLKYKHVLLLLMQPLNLNLFSCINLSDLLW